MIEGDWSGRVTGLRDQGVGIAMMRMPDGHGRIELSRFLAPPVVADHRNAPAIRPRPESDVEGVGSPAPSITRARANARVPQGSVGELHSTRIVPCGA